MCGSDIVKMLSKSHETLSCTVHTRVKISITYQSYQIYSYIFSFRERPQTGRYVKKEHRFEALRIKNEGTGCEVANVSVDFSATLVIFLKCNVLMITEVWEYTKKWTIYF